MTLETLSNSTTNASCERLQRVSFGRLWWTGPGTVCFLSQFILSSKDASNFEVMLDITFRFFSLKDTWNFIVEQYRFVHTHTDPPHHTHTHTHTCKHALILTLRIVESWRGAQRWQSEDEWPSRVSLSWHSDNYMPISHTLISAIDAHKHAQTHHVAYRFIDQAHAYTLVSETARATCVLPVAR